MNRTNFRNSISLSHLIPHSYFFYYILSMPRIERWVHCICFLLVFVLCLKHFIEWQFNWHCRFYLSSYFLFRALFIKCALLTIFDGQASEWGSERASWQAIRQTIVVSSDRKHTHTHARDCIALSILQSVFVNFVSAYCFQSLCLYNWLALSLTLVWLCVCVCALFRWRTFYHVFGIWPNTLHLLTKIKIKQ